ncbi:3-oxoacyl-ACP synthase [Mesorhizobium sp. M2E.F.Ca.ET.209.01.1.1]|uniref:3-oxoacyl-ACP synthase n=1 Tax=Mesorhizobium sp. M2E.F.Ca.ET.209.01.1.1 TaxID=2500526 RepID=UPI000FD90DBA|nr:3-oxoacyl-ACP synthase [Mesorhizobium sp. M2E.F.Ca.ET.209.01.1.1]TGS13810.1 3-oxoacyl-ACP synthase [Mesorhizobium sp. M2E.F.Ca.ET.209.01.1.1]
MNGTIDIASVGMVTSVGLDAPASCAAMRARLDGFRETRFTGARGEPLIGAPVPLPRDWVGERRIAHLAAGAISEALSGARIAGEQTALILCLAEEGRSGRPVRDASRLLRKIADIVEIAPHVKSRIISYGRPSGHVALEQARRLISSAQVANVVIAGVDSYLTSRTVRHYLDQSRLLTKFNPNGFIPGEAAAAVLCTKPGQGTLTLLGLGLAREPATIYNKQDLPLRGEGMAAAYGLALRESRFAMVGIGYRISDLIGEQYWFKQTALAFLRHMRGHVDFQDLWSPGESIGNIGAAVVPTMIGMAFTAARKGYAAGNPVLIEASNDEGACGAAVVASRLN